MVDAPIVMRVLASSVQLAARASTIVRNVFASKDLEIVDKGVNDLQSRADRDAQRCIVGSLTQAFPGLKVIGEEGPLDTNGLSTVLDLDPNVMQHQCPAAYKSVPLSDLVVWVDPLDGTMEFTEGLVEHVTILIGVAVSGKPVAGVIAQPFYHPNKTKPGDPVVAADSTTRVIWGMNGLGVFGIEPKKPAGALPYPLNPSASRGTLPHVIVTTRSHATSKLASAIEACAPTEVLRAGGCGYKVLMLLEGLGHLYLFPSIGAKRWDTCAPEAVLSAAGGALTDLRGNHYDYQSSVDPMDRGGILATPIADWIPVYTPLIPKDVLDTLTFPN